MTTTLLPHTIQAVMETLRQEKLIAVIRANTPDDALWGADILIEKGFHIIEVTFSVPQAPMVIETLADRYPQVLLGAGTVMNPRQGIQALGAGARFLVSPVLDDAMVQWGLEQGVLTIPGAMSPTEIHHALCLGAPAVKLFPALQAGGPKFIKALTEPMGPVPVIPTGGIGVESFTEYLKNGALAVGLGGHLIPQTAIGERNRKEVEKRARQFRERLERFHQRRG